MYIIFENKNQHFPPFFTFYWKNKWQSSVHISTANKKDLDYHLPWQWRSPSKLTRILSTKPFLYSYTLYVCRWRLLLGPQLESGRARVLILYKLGNILILNKNTIVKTLSFLHVSILVFIQENTYLSRKKNHSCQTTMIWTQSKQCMFYLYYF